MCFRTPHEAAIKLTRCNKALFIKQFCKDLTISFLSFRWELTNQNQLLRCNCRIPGMTGWTRLWDVAFKRADTFVWRGGQCQNDFIKSGWNWRTTTCTHVAACDFCSSSQQTVYPSLKLFQWYPSSRNSPNVTKKNEREFFSNLKAFKSPRHPTSREVFCFV